MQRALLAGSLLGLLASLACQRYEHGPGVDPQVLKGKDQSLTFLHTSDWHSRLFPYRYDPPVPLQRHGLIPENAPFGGVSRLATLIKEQRAKSSRVLHLDSGDCFQGAPVFNEYDGEAELRAYNQLGLDGSVIGNHEFDKGMTNFVDQAAQWARYPLLAANYRGEDFERIGNKALADVMQPYVILNARGIKVAAIGLANYSSLNSLGEGGNSLGLQPLEMIETTQSYIDFLANQVDLMVVVSHLGLSDDIEVIEGYHRWYRQAEYDRLPGSPYPPCGDLARPPSRCERLAAVLPSQQECPEDVVEGQLCGLERAQHQGDKQIWIPGVRGIDLILGGHLHYVTSPPREVEDRDGRIVPVVHSGAFMQFLARLDVVLREAERMGRNPWFGWEIASFRHRLFAVDSTVRKDPEMERLMERYLVGLSQRLRLDEPVAWSHVEINRTSPAGGDSPLGNLVADAMRMRNRVRTDFALTNSMGIRDNVPPGLVTLEQLFNVFPFENSIATLFLSGVEVQEMFNFVSARSAGRGCRSQAQIAGASFVMRCDCSDTVVDGCCASAALSETGGMGCAEEIQINGEALDLGESYELAANDYIAGGGSGFEVLERNTTQFNTGISLRDAVADYLRSMPECRVEDVPPELRASFDEALELYGSLHCVPTGASCEAGGQVCSQDTDCGDGDPCMRPTARIRAIP